MMQYQIHKFLPKKSLSQIFGRVSQRRHPIVVRSLIGFFIKTTGASLAEAKRKNISDHISLNDFFTRELKEGVRPIGEGIVSPVDGCVANAGAIEEDDFFAVKGYGYSLRQLVGEDCADDYHHGQAVTLYLAPDDYHRIHAPEDSSIVSGQYVPGEHNSVSLSIVSKVQGLFACNERVVYEMQRQGL